MKQSQKTSPICPKCGSHQTTDIVHPPQCVTDIQFYGDEEDDFPLVYTRGNGKYYCMNCKYTWKKYRGKKPYESINKITVCSGGFPGPSFNIDINLQTKQIDYEQHFSIPSIIKPVITDEEKKWFLEELYKCDFLNWAEIYEQPFVLDGNHWSIRIELDTHCEIKHGSNHFPQKWSKFCESISKMSGNEFY